MNAPQLPAELVSPRAFAKYRALVTTGRRIPAPIHALYGLETIERSWKLMNAVDARRYGLDVRLLRALAWAHARYADMAGISDGAFAPYRDEERRAYPTLFEGAGVYSLDAAAGFMADACQMPLGQAFLWICRYREKAVRSGRFFECTDAPAWAYARAKNHDDRTLEEADVQRLRQGLTNI